MIDFEKYDFIILVKDPSTQQGTKERFLGLKNAKSLRSRLYRSRAHNPGCTVTLYACRLSLCSKTNSMTYFELDVSLNIIENHSIRVAPGKIIEKPAAMIAAQKRGKANKSAENGKKGGRPTDEPQ